MAQDGDRNASSQAGQAQSTANATHDGEKREGERPDRERELFLKEKEIEAKLLELRRSQFANPLAIAIFAASIAAAGNIYVSYQNGIEQQIVEEGKAEAARILEAIKTSDADSAAANLRFLLGAGLINNARRRQDIDHYLRVRPGGQGANIQVNAPQTPAPPQAPPESQDNLPKLPEPLDVPGMLVYQTGWLPAGHSQAEACQRGVSALQAQHPSKKLERIGSNENAHRDSAGRRFYNYTCTFKID